VTIKKRTPKGRQATVGFNKKRERGGGKTGKTELTTPCGRERKTESGWKNENV